MIALNILFLAGSIQGLSLSLGFGLRYLSKKEQNPFFIFLTSLLTIILLAKFSYTNERFIQAPHHWYLVDLLAYFFGPIWFLMIKKGLGQTLTFRLKDYLLLSPILYYLVFLGYIYSLSTPELVKFISADFNLVTFYSFCITVFMVNLGFAINAYLFLNKNKTPKTPSALTIGHYFFMGIIVLWLLCLVLNAIFFHSFQIDLWAFEFAFLGLSLFCLMLSLIAFAKPEAFSFLHKKYNHEEQVQLTHISKRIQSYLAEKQAFLRPKFTLAELSQGIQQNQVITSKAINSILQTSFNDLINAYRVQFFIELSQQYEKQNLTLWALAQESGFGNKVTFYKAFKKEKGHTPKAYLDLLKKGVKNHNY